MNTKLRSILVVLAVTLLASCESLTMPGETKALGETQRAAIARIRYLEQNLYQCVSSQFVIENTKFLSMLGREYVEEWRVPSCTGDIHTYIVAYTSEIAQTWVFHKKIDNSEVISSSLWSGGGLIKNNYIGKKAINAFDRKINAARLMILNEPPNAQALLQKIKDDQSTNKTWHSLCDTPLLEFEAMRIDNAVKNEGPYGTDRFLFTHCYQWHGTRNDWKKRILSKEGAWLRNHK